MTREFDSGSFNHFFTQAKVRDVMDTKVVTVREDDDFSVAQRKFVENHITHLVIVNNQYQLVGLISQKYIYKTQSPRKIIGDELEPDPGILLDGDSFYLKETLDSYILRNIMKKNPFVLTPDDSLAEVIINMAKKNLGCIPIVDANRKICGVVTSQEIVQYLADKIK